MTRWLTYRFSLIVPLDADRWVVHDQTGKQSAAFGVSADRARMHFDAIANDIRTKEGRKYVTLWVRGMVAAREHNVGRVLWAGNSAGPGFDAHKEGQYSIDKLIEVVHFHIGMMS